MKKVLILLVILSSAASSFSMNAPGTRINPVTGQREKLITIHGFTQQGAPTTIEVWVKPSLEIIDE
ncbi:hypothetical protein HYX58_01975 [Candidatus Dependentiae bacterium]|nr:hypothetical protein [Candidatus Dependentiae bacterium]